MKTRSADRTGLLIVRLWIEGNAREGFRARITQTLDSTNHEQTMSAAASPEEIYTAVQGWVEEIVDLNRAATPDHALPSSDGRVTPRGDAIHDGSAHRR